MSHKAFKDAYRNISKPKATAKEGTSCKVAKKQNRFFAGKSSQFYNGQSASNRFSGTDCYLVNFGRLITLLQFENCRRLMYYHTEKNCSLGEVGVYPYTLQVCASLGENRTERILILLREHMSHIGVASTFVPHTKL